MSASSVTGIGHGAVANISNSELNSLFNAFEQIQARFPSAQFSTIEVALDDNDPPTICSVDVILKNYLGEYSLLPSQLIYFFSTSPTSIVYADVEIFTNSVEMANGEEDLNCPFSSFGLSCKQMLIPSHTEDYVLRIEFYSTYEETISGFYFGLMFPDGTFKISDTEITLG